MIMRTLISAVLFIACATAATAGPNCTCRYKGENFQIGEVACILGELKQCEMALNNTSWRTLSEGCPQAGLHQPRPLQSKAVSQSYRTSALTDATSAH